MIGDDYTTEGQLEQWHPPRINMNPVRECNTRAGGDQQMEVDNTESQYEALPSGFCAFSEQEVTSYVLAMTQAGVEPPHKPDEPSTTQEKDVADGDEPIGNMDRATAGYDLADEDVDFDVNDDFDCVTDKADAGTGTGAIGTLATHFVPPSCFWPWEARHRLYRVPQHACGEHQTHPSRTTLGTCVMTQ